MSYSGNLHLLAHLREKCDSEFRCRLCLLLPSSAFGQEQTSPQTCANPCAESSPVAAICPARRATLCDNLFHMSRSGYASDRCLSP